MSRRGGRRRWPLAAVGVVVALVLAVAAIGYFLPVAHVASVAATIPAPPESVWTAVASPATYDRWHPGVSRVDVLPPVNGRPSWRETSGDGTITYVAEASEPPRRFVARIADHDLPFGGTWEYRLAPEGTGTRVTVTERGEVYNPIFRFVSRFVVGHTKTLTDYLKALGRRFGSEAAPAVVTAP